MRLISIGNFASGVIGAYLSIPSHFNILFLLMMFSFLFKILILLSFSNVCWLSLINISSVILISRGCKLEFTWILFRVLDFLSFKLSIKRHIKAIIRFSFISQLYFSMFATSLTLIVNGTKSQEANIWLILYLNMGQFLVHGTKHFTWQYF